MTFWNEILRYHADATLRTAWLMEKRDEAERLFRTERREWINAGAHPQPKQWKDA